MFQHSTPTSSETIFKLAQSGNDISETQEVGVNDSQHVAKEAVVNSEMYVFWSVINFIICATRCWKSQNTL
jgi:hypothetical protein